MVYVKGAIDMDILRRPAIDMDILRRADGTVVERSPMTMLGWLWAFLNFCYLLFQTLVNPNYNKRGDKYTRDFRPPGSGPPKPPSKKFGGFGPSGSGPSPPPMGGCGCGG